MTLLHRFLAFFRRSRLDREMDEEMRAHLERETEQNLAHGLSPSEARRAARLAFGGLDQLKERERDARSWPGLENLLRDFRHAGRSLLKSPGFSAVALLSLGLGIGAATTLFSVFDALVLDPFPYPHPERIVYVRSNGGQPLSPPDYQDIREQTNSFAELGVYSTTRLNLGAKSPESLPAIKCTAGVLRVLGVKPALGRWLDESDQAMGAAPVAVISHALWVRAFNGDPAIVGRTITLADRPTEVVGVMPASFEFASPWYEGHDYEVWAPLQLDDPNAVNNGRGDHWLLGLGRLKPDTTVATADAEIKTVGARLTREYPSSNTNKPLLVRSIRDELTRDTSAGMRPLAIAVALLLLVACANVTGLLLARGTRRQTEFGIRMALGASRPALFRQILSETLLLGLLGCAAGVVLSSWGVAAFRQLIPAALIIEARRSAIDLNGWVLLFAIVTALTSALLTGLYPAMVAARTSVSDRINDGGRSQTHSRGRNRVLRQLVVAQIAIAVLLANATFLFVASYLNLFKSNQALETDQVLTAELSTLGERYQNAGDRVRFWNNLIERVQSLPGVRHVAMTDKLPLEGGSNFDVLVDDQKFDPEIRRPLVENSGISPDYFRAMGLGWLRGQPANFGAIRGSMVPVVINQAMVRTCWPDADPIGRHVRINGFELPFTFEVIGVVEDVRQWGAEHRPLPELYYPSTLEEGPEEATPTSAYLVVRTDHDAPALVPAIRRELATIDPGIPLANVRTMREVLHQAGSRRRLSTSVTNLFMAITLTLAAIGIYGTLSYILSGRTRELGIRIALGANTGQIFALVLSQATRWLLAGLALGLALAAACSWGLRSLVYGVNPLDPVFLALGAGVVGIAMIVACLVPARRAARTDPIVALRIE